MSVANLSHADTLAQRAVYDMKVLVGGDPAEVGQCSAFTFGDVRTVCGENIGPFVDNEETSIPAFDIPGGNGIEGDGIAGTLQIETDKSDESGNNTFSILSYQVDPYLQTPGGTFKVTTETLGLGNNKGGTLGPTGQMTMDMTGRTGVTAKFFNTIGQQPWNVDDSQAIADSGLPTTGLWEPFTTGDSSHFILGLGDPETNTLTGRPIGDENTDGILDAILISVGNVGNAWGDFDGTPYSEAFNVQFSLVSAKPVANPDVVNTTEGTSLLIDETDDLLVNDTIATNVALTFSGFTQPTEAGSSVVDNNNGTLTYTPAGGFSGVDTFTYTIEDPAMETDSTTVTVNVSAAGNSPPTANDINVTTDEDTPLDVDPTTNDTDPDGDPLTITAFDTPSVRNGIVIDQGNNTLTYSPAPDFNGDDSFGYTISDGKGGTDSATVFVTVNSVNDPLECTDVKTRTDISTALDIDVADELLITCTDVPAENDPITLDSFTQPIEAGSAVTSNGGTLTYTPAAGFSGQDSFTYTATDGTDTDTKTVLVDVGKVLGNFTMLDSDGVTFGGTNDVASTWDETLNLDVTDTNFNVTMKTDSDFPFFGFVWEAHEIRMFGPGTYMFDTSCSTAQVQQGLADCGGAPDEFLTLTIGHGQIGAHMLFDWNVTENIDVVNLYEANAIFPSADPAGALYQGPAGPTPDVNCLFEYASIDGDGDGIPGVKFIDGPFIGFRANFNQNFKQNCGAAGEVEVEKSSIKSSDPGGGCTLSGATTTPLSRGDYWLMLGCIASLGAFVTRRRILTDE